MEEFEHYEPVNLPGTEFETRQMAARKAEALEAHKKKRFRVMLKPCGHSTMC